MSAPGTRRASFFDHSPPMPVFAPPHQTIWSTFLQCLRIWPILCAQFMMMARVVGVPFCVVNFSHSPAYATCFAQKVCGLVRSTWGTLLGGDKLGAGDRILNTKVPRPPHVQPPPRVHGSPPPWGEPSPSDGSPPGGGGTVHHSRPANSSITQLKIFFGAFGACDFLLISYCSWAK